MLFRTLLEALDAAPAGRPFITMWIGDDEQQSITFSEFRLQARAQAAILRECGVGAGDRVVIIMPQGIPAMTEFVGAMMLGAVPAFLAYPNFKIDPAKYQAGLAGVTTNLNAKAVVVDHDFPEEMLGHVSTAGETHLLRLGLAATAPAPEISFRAPAPENLAFIQHSAGTTGLQKGVALTHAAVLRQIEHLRRALHINAASDRIYSWLPLYHDMGLIACFMLPMACHLSIVMQPPMDWVMHPETMLQIISQHRCTLAWMPNFAFQFVPRRMCPQTPGRYDLSCLRALINCSEPVRSASMLEFQKAFAMAPRVLQSSYAMAENVFAVTQSDLDCLSGPVTLWADATAFRSFHQILPVPRETRDALVFTSSGRLLPNHQIRIVSDSGESLTDGFVGEILVQSDCLFDGYFNRSDLTASAMVDGWYRTGDLGFCVDGELFVVGRKKDLLIVGGENLYPQDIEEIVAAHPAIHDGRAIALGIYNPDLGTEDVVVVAEVERENLLAGAADIETQVRSLVVAALGVAIRTIFLKPPKWIVKSTAGKPARSATREKLLREHPELRVES